MAAHLSIDNTIEDLLKHPAFAGFGRLTLPWDDRRYDPGVRLRDIGSLSRTTAMSIPASSWRRSIE